MTTRLKPLGNRVILRKIDQGSHGGVAIPKTVERDDDGTQEFEVVESAGDHTCTKPRCHYTHSGGLHVGSRIYLARYKGWKVLTSSGEELYIADVDDVLAVEVDDEKG